MRSNLQVLAANMSVNSLLSDGERDRCHTYRPNINGFILLLKVHSKAPRVENPQLLAAIQKLSAEIVRRLQILSQNID